MVSHALAGVCWRSSRWRWRYLSFSLLAGCTKNNRDRLVCSCHSKKTSDLFQKLTIYIYFSYNFSFTFLVKLQLQHFRCCAPLLLYFLLSKKTTIYIYFCSRPSLGSATWGPPLPPLADSSIIVLYTWTMLSFILVRFLFESSFQNLLLLVGLFYVPTGNMLWELLYVPMFLCSNASIF